MLSEQKNPTVVMSKIEKLTNKLNILANSYRNPYFLTLLGKYCDIYRISL